jgi:DNA mismatch repair protein MutS
MFRHCMNMRAVFCAVFLQFVPAIARQEVSFETVATLHLKSFGLELKTPNVDNQKKIDPKDYNNPEVIKEILQVNIPNDEKRRLVYQVFVRNEQTRGFDATQDDQNLKTLLEDLDVYYGHGEDSRATVYNHLFEGRVNTLFGEAMAIKNLARVEVDQAKLADNQKLIVHLSENAELYAKLDDLLHQLKDAESNMVSFWKEEHPIVKELVKKLYFGKIFPERFNKHANKLELLTRLDNIHLAFQFGGDYIMSIGVCYAVKKLMSLPISLRNAAHDALAAHNPKMGIDFILLQNTPDGYKERDEAIKRANAIAGKIATHQEMEKQHADYKKKFYFLGGLMTLASVINIYNKISSIRSFIDDFKQKRDVAKFLQDRLMSVSTYLRVLKQIYELSKQHPELAKALPVDSVYKNLFAAGSDDLHQLVQMLMTGTFKGSSSFFSRTGRVLASYSLMQTCKDGFVDMLKLLGSLDASLATAKLYKQFECHDRAVYSFAQFCKNDGPCIKAIELWNPLIDPIMVVTNDIRLGQTGQARNMIITGSNKGGKSTILKSILTGALLAQTLTIVPASTYVACPFYLYSSMNISDDVAQGRSLFQAEVLGIKKLVRSIDSLDETAYGLVAIDEVFIGTGAGKAAPAAYKLAKHLSASPRICFILATHFIEDLSKLEQDTHGVVANYKVDAEKLSNGKIIFRHKLEPGVSSCNIANDILQEELQGIDFEMHDDAELV